MNFKPQNLYVITTKYNQYTYPIPTYVVIFSIEPKNIRSTKFGYSVYSFMDMILLFLLYPLMLANRFCVGFLGISSATIRESSVNSYLPPNMRSKVNAVFNVLFSFAMIIMQIFSGLLGDKFSYRTVCVVMSLIGMVGIFIFIVLPSNENRKVYESTRVKV